MPRPNEEHRRQRSIVALMLDDSPHTRSALAAYIWDYLQEETQRGHEVDKTHIVMAIEAWTSINKE